MDISALALSKLLNCDQENSSEDDEPSSNLGTKLGPGNIGPASSSSKQKLKDVYGKKCSLAYVLVCTDFS